MSADEELLPCRHPSITDRQAELKGLADVVRRLVDLTVTNTANGPDTVAITEELAEIADRLEAHVPDPIVPRLYTGGGPEVGYDNMPYDPVTGAYNPLAIPLELGVEDGRAVGNVTFTTPYEGPPGCVHGAVLAGAFDMVLTQANLLADAAGPTMELTIRFRKPTLLHTPTRFEAWVAERNGRVTTAAGHATQGDTVTVEAIGKFIALDRKDIIKLARRAGGGST
jgi:acyl-coenzyme A thioesterase PaaI-like protein